MNHTNETKPRCCYPREVFSATFPVLEESAVCRLYQTHTSPPSFSVEIEFAGECARAFLGSGFARAARIVELLMEGSVTPCTLADVVEGL